MFAFFLISFIAVVASRTVEHKHHHHHHTHEMKERSPEEQSLYGPDYVLYDDAGIAYVNCVTKIGDMVLTQKCSAADEESMGPKPNGLACMSVVKSKNVIMQGCWIHQDEGGLAQCSRKQCVISGDAYDGTSFCCCRGHECNNNVVFEDGTER